MLRGPKNLQSLSSGDESKEVPAPEVEKSIHENNEIFPLLDVENLKLKTENIFECIKKRKSLRKFADSPMSLEDLSFLLWATQGVRSKLLSKKTGKINALFKNVPSAGARHPIETYLAVLNVASLKKGIYRYSSLTHSLVFLKEEKNLEGKIEEALLGQKFCTQTPVLFCWAALPYRTQWRYSDHATKFILLDAGHIGQNLHLAAEALNLGTCMIGAYNQEKTDELFGLDGKDELAIYLAPVGVHF